MRECVVSGISLAVIALSTVWRSLKSLVFVQRPSQKLLVALPSQNLTKVNKQHLIYLQGKAAPQTVAPPSQELSNQEKTTERLAVQLQKMVHVLSCLN